MTVMDTSTAIWSEGTHTCVTGHDFFPPSFLMYYFCIKLKSIINHYLYFEKNIDISSKSFFKNENMVLFLFMQHRYGEIISFYVSVFKKIQPTAGASMSHECLSWALVAVDFLMLGFKKDSISSLVLYEYLQAPQRWGVAVR